MVHLELVREGAEHSTGSGNSSPTSIPGTEDAEWVQLGLITVASELPVIGNAIDIIAPKANGGTLELRKRIHLGPISRVFTFTAVDYSHFTVELASLAGEIDDSEVADGALSIYTPFDGDTAPIRGWWKLRWLDENDVMVRREMLWAELRLAQALAAGPGGAITPQFTLTVFPNALNIGSLLKRNDA